MGAIAPIPHPFGRLIAYPYGAISAGFQATRSSGDVTPTHCFVSEMRSARATRLRESI
jgi:hypothetical protein